MRKGGSFMAVGIDNGVLFQAEGNQITREINNDKANITKR